MKKKYEKYGVRINEEESELIEQWCKKTKRTRSSLVHCEVMDLIRKELGK